MDDAGGELVQDLTLSNSNTQNSTGIVGYVWYIIVACSIWFSMLFVLFLAAAQDFEALENGTSEKICPLGTETEEGTEGEGENSGTENMVNIFLCTQRGVKLLVFL